MSAPPSQSDAAGMHTELMRRFGLEGTPESVTRLTQLIAGRDSDLDELARVIDQDPHLRRRLLRAANPGVGSEAQFMIETAGEALMRIGVGCALLMAMGTPLALALTKTFQTMLSMKLDNINPQIAPPLEGQYIRATIRFTGKAVGRVNLRMSVNSAGVIAGTLLGSGPTGLTPGIINDTVGELLNIMTGNFKSNLSDAGLDCRLEPPQVWRTDERYVATVRGGGLERMAFRAGQLILFVDVAVNPWNDE